MRVGPIGPSPSGATRLPALAEEDGDVGALVRVERAERVGERLRRLAIDRVAPVRTREDDRRDAPLLLRADRHPLRLRMTS
jgi:hypothetical protein